MRILMLTGSAPAPGCGFPRPRGKRREILQECQSCPVPVPPPGAVVRALPRRAKLASADSSVEIIRRIEISRTPVSVTLARGWTPVLRGTAEGGRGASSHTRSVCASLRRDRAEAGGEGGGGCAPQLWNSGSGEPTTMLAREVRCLVLHTSRPMAAYVLAR
jgi:hypothetical protein